MLLTHDPAATVASADAGTLSCLGISPLTGRWL
jgi:hypothetical protein